MSCTLFHIREAIPYCTLVCKNCNGLYDFDEEDEEFRREEQGDCFIPGKFMYCQHCYQEVWDDIESENIHPNVCDASFFPRLLMDRIEDDEELPNLDNLTIRMATPEEDRNVRDRLFKFLDWMNKANNDEPDENFNELGIEMAQSVLRAAFWQWLLTFNDIDVEDIQPLAPPSYEDATAPPAWTPRYTE